MKRVLALVALLCGSAAGCSRPSPGAAPSHEIEALLTKVEAGRVRPGSRVRVTGVVTDDDAARRLAFIADANRAVAVHTAPGGLATAPGQRAPSLSVSLYLPSISMEIMVPSDTVPILRAAREELVASLPKDQRIR